MVGFGGRVAGAIEVPREGRLRTVLDLRCGENESL